MLSSLNLLYALYFYFLFNRKKYLPKIIKPCWKSFSTWWYRKRRILIFLWDSIPLRFMLRPAFGSLLHIKWFSADGEESACNAGDPDSTPGSGRSSREGNGYPLPYSCLENSMDRPWGCKESDTTEQLTHRWVSRAPWVFWSLGK